MDTILQDLRYALRTLQTRPGFTAVAVLILGLGIGANTAVFTFINGVLFKPGHVREPEQLVWLTPTSAGRFRSLSYPDYVQFRDRVRSFSGAIAWSSASLALGGQTPERVAGLVVTAGFFDLLGERPALGRGFVMAEDQERGAHPVVVLGHNFWQRRFGSDPFILDSSIIVNGRAFRVVGVAPEEFTGVDLGSRADIFLPAGMLSVAMPGNGGLLDQPEAGWLRAVARLRDDVDIRTAQAEVDVVAASLHVDRSADDRYGAQLTGMTGPIDPSNRHQVAPILGLVALVPLLVLAVACANIASLLLAQGIARRRELAIRRALGASRARLVGQLLTESVVLAAIAAVAGVALASWMLAVIVRLGRVPAEVTAALVPDGRVFALTAALSLVAGIVFGLLPALAATRTPLQPALKDEAIGVTAGRGRHRLRNGFVVAQIAASLVLLITAGLFIRSFGKALHVDPGFDAAPVAAVSFDLDLQGYSAERQRAFRDRLMERVTGLPGVASAAYASVVPMSGRNFGTVAAREGAASEHDDVPVSLTEVSPEYFATLGIPLLRGRGFTDRDNASAPPVVIVNEALARSVWPDADPIGQRLLISAGGERLREVIAVARDGKYRNLIDPPQPFLFLPLAQRPVEGEVTLLVRAAGNPASMIRDVSALVTELDRNLPLGNAATMRDIIANRATGQRAAGAMLGVFGALALVLAALGIYGVAAYGVTQRTREIGIRMSLGARRADVFALFLRGALTLGLVGVAIGVAGSAAVSGLLSAFLFGLTATDGLTFAAAAAILMGIVTLATYLPARRAVKVDPVVALRTE